MSDDDYVGVNWLRGAGAECKDDGTPWTASWCFTKAADNFEAAIRERDDALLRLDSGVLSRDLDHGHGRIGKGCKYETVETMLKSRLEAAQNSIAENAELRERNRILQQAVNTNAELVIQLRATSNEQCRRLGKIHKLLTKVHEPVPAEVGMGIVIGTLEQVLELSAPAVERHALESQSRDTQEAMADSAEDRREAARRGEL